jgi:hypothetical protein
MNLITRLITVGQTKTDAGSGRTVPMNDELMAAAVDYSQWYTGQFGSANPDWHVFPLGKPAPKTPTRPRTSIKTAWLNTRAKARVEWNFMITATRLLRT